MSVIVNLYQYLLPVRFGGRGYNLLAPMTNNESGGVIAY